MEGGALLEGSGSGSSEDGNSKVGESESLERVQNSRESSGGSVHKNSVHVSHINDHNKFAKIFAEIDVGYSTCLHEFPVNLKKGLMSVFNLPFLCYILNNNNHPHIISLIKT